MKRLQLLVALWALFALGASAQAISMAQAQKRAEAFLSKQGRQLQLTIAETPAMRARTRGEEAKDYYFAFNAGKNEGFVIASTDLRAPAVLGYSKEGCFNIDDLPEVVAHWLEGYAEQIKYIQENNLCSSGTRAAFGIHPAVPDLMKSKWSQRSPYYNDCPMWNGRFCLAGCVSISMAQVMYYHKFPKGNTTSIPSYTTTTHSIEMPSLKATTFDWDQMKDRYSSGDSEASKAAVAHLVAYCSTAIEADFDPSNTNAYYSKQRKSLTEYFGYGEWVQFLYRPNFKDTEWEDIIYKEIANKRPVLYSGQTADKAGMGGHSFVLHGYDGQGYYAVNWGWGGSYDGYYLLDAMEPDYKYNYRQYATIGISPEDVSKPSNILRTTQENGKQKMYDLSGRQIDGKAENRLVIVKEADGTTKKVYHKTK